MLLPVAVFFFFSAQLGSPSRWLRAQPKLSTHNSKMLGGRAPWGSGSLPPHPLGRVGTSLALPEYRCKHAPLSCCWAATTGNETPEWAQSEEALPPLPLDNRRPGGRGEEWRVDFSSVGCGPPSGLP